MACLEPLANPSLNPHVRRQSVVAHLWHERSSNEIACTILQSAIELQHEILCFDGNGLRRGGSNLGFDGMAASGNRAEPVCSLDCKSFIINKSSWKIAVVCGWDLVCRIAVSCARVFQISGSL